MPSLSFRAKSESSLHMSMVTGFEASDWSKFSLFLHFVFVGHGVVVFSMGFRFSVSMGLAVEAEFELEYGVGELRGQLGGGGGGGGHELGNAILAVVDMYFRRDEFLLYAGEP